MLNFIVDDARCTRCGLCVKDCPVRIIERQGDACPTIIAAEAGDCMGCQHCLAICPAGAISILGRSPDDSRPLTSGALPTLDAVELLVRGRRSVRQYREENVDPALLKRLLDALANVPTGVNRQELTFRLIDDRAVMECFKAKAMSDVRSALAAGEIPEAMSSISRLPVAYFEEGRDLVFRGAPHALIVTAPPDAPCAREDVTLALAYFELLAQSAGLGTVWCGMLSWVLSARPNLKTDLGIPEGHLHYQMLFGYPAVQYARTVQRDDGARVERISI